MKRTHRPYGTRGIRLDPGQEAEVDAVNEYLRQRFGGKFSFSACVRYLLDLGLRAHEAGRGGFGRVPPMGSVRKSPVASVEPPGSSVDPPVGSVRSPEGSVGSSPEVSVEVPPVLWAGEDFLNLLLREPAR